MPYNVSWLSYEKLIKGNIENEIDLEFPAVQGA